MKDLKISPKGGILFSKGVEGMGIQGDDLPNAQLTEEGDVGFREIFKKPRFAQNANFIAVAGFPLSKDSEGDTRPDEIPAHRLRDLPAPLS
jgi:hypothetical protein